jgi:mannosyltransferase OCH1-like enzyme
MPKLNTAHPVMNQTMERSRMATSEAAATMNTTLQITKPSAYDLLQHYPTITLDELIKTNPNPACRPKRVIGKNNKETIIESILVESITGTSHPITHPPNRKIPRIVHVTSKTRCMPQKIIDNIQRWQLPDHNFYVHDDEAVNRLLWETYWPEFPHLNLLRPCLISGAALADLWRYLVLYQYGGIYADIDSAPGNLFQNGTVIADDDDAWFVVERIGTLSQYFMASSPKHPLMHLAVTVTLRRLLEVQVIGKQYVPYVTGPGALKEAWNHFLYNYPDEKGTAVEEEDTIEEQQGLDEREEDENENKQEADAGNDGNDTENLPPQNRQRLQEVADTPPPPQQQQQPSGQIGSKTLDEMKQPLEAQVQQQQQQQQQDPKPKSKKKKKRKSVLPGVYTGMLGRTVTIMGTRKVSRHVYG